MMYKPGPSTGTVRNIQNARWTWTTTRNHCPQCICQPKTSTIRTALSWIFLSSQLTEPCIKNSRNSQKWLVQLTPRIDLLSGRQHATRTLSSLVLMASSLLLLCTWMPSLNQRTCRGTARIGLCCGPLRRLAVLAARIGVTVARLLVLAVLGPLRIAVVVERGQGSTAARVPTMSAAVAAFATERFPCRQAAIGSLVFDLCAPSGAQCLSQQYLSVNLVSPAERATQKQITTVACPS